MKTKSLALGLIVGSTVGAAVSILNAPRSGKDTRENFKQQANELKHAIEQVKVNGKVLSDQIIATSKEGAELIKDLSKDMKGSIEQWQQTIKPHQDNIEQYLKEIETRLQELEQETQPTSS